MLTNEFNEFSENIEINFKFESNLNSIYNLWKITNLNQDLLNCKNSCNKRLNNRSWRLLNKKLIQKNENYLQDLSKESLSNLKPNKNQFLSNSNSYNNSNRPLLFLNNSKSTLFSHNSKLSLNGNQINQDITPISSSNMKNLHNNNLQSYDSDTSDISEDDEEFVSSDDDDEQEQVPVPKPQLNRSRTSFVRGFLPNQISSSKNIFYITPSPKNDGSQSDNYTKHDGSQSENYKDDGSPLENYKDDGSQSENYKDDGSQSENYKDDGSPSENYKNDGSQSENYTKHDGSQLENYTKHDGSQSENYKPNDTKNQLQETKPPIQRQPSLFNNKISYNQGDTSLSSTDISEDESEDEFRPPPTIPSQNNSLQTYQNSTKSNESEWLSVSSESDHLSHSPTPLKFDKKKSIQIPNSSLSKIHSGETDIIKQDDSKPRSLLSGLFLNELNDSSKKPLLKRSSTTGIITVDQDHSAIGCDKNKIKRPSILFQKKYTSMTDISKNYPHYQTNLLRTSIWNDLSSPPKPKPFVDDENSNNLFTKNKSIVGVSDFNVTTKSDPANDIPSSNHAFKNIISKSSLSLSNLFYQSKKYHGKHKSNKPTPEIKSSETSFNSLDQSPSLNNNSVKTGSETIDTPLETDSFSKKLSPKSTRREMMLSELSNSLKESILIDYRLGKVPLPTHVIKDEELLKNHKNRLGLDPNENDSDENHDLDDYHSKGW
ncbi:hypothetical protein HYPBUDRAFT_11010 [Hyphopichia burtonii NRRL Y-1933]|uniref:Nitrogen regulatory protein areA GATA-like domain-containing protein n=1 Tax=Hyphopichia burtonii NRRL Y-1933 TaxID=984485 RepID=A0A1E4RL68_9ASCO|nr:hypothetical protein HYPBUDRAFT_11010 [Hyphopichia burtonii NRRL Y-1933]ODV67845.1 hypothetical protein HYPBUDRAFT_11010 [Hyphopichia burtonii NRRL Y-1933]